MADIIFTLIICVTIVMLPRLFKANRNPAAGMLGHRSKNRRKTARNASGVQLSMVLTPAALTETGRNELQLLRPGERLCLEGIGDPGLCRVRVFARGREIGEILPDCVKKVWRAMRRHRVCGAYVADIATGTAPSTPEMQIALLCKGASSEDTDNVPSFTEMQRAASSSSNISVKMCNRFTLFLN